MAKPIDLTGTRFGRLMVIRRVEDKIIGKDKRRSVAWECKCDCGVTKIILGESLRSGKTKSCGCYSLEMSKSKRKENTFYKENDYMVGITSNGDKFYFDEEDFSLVKERCWRLSPFGYVVTSIHKDNQSQNIYLHRLIMNPPDNLIVDHINHNKADNRRLNLRTCSTANNAWNFAGRSDNTSGHRGVYFSKTSGKWFARITVNGEVLSIGSFALFDDAVKARLDAEKRYFEDFAYNPNANKILQDTKEN